MYNHVNNNDIDDASFFIIQKDFFYKHQNDNIRIFLCWFDEKKYHDNLFEALNINFPESLFHAVKKRKTDYLAGRYCAKTVMKHFTSTPCDIKTGPCRSPLFPSFLRGSISHTQNIACSAIARSDKIKALGIDIETIIENSVINAISEKILCEEELLLIKKQPYYVNSDLFSAVFSAKESLFKAIFPFVGFYFGFHSVKLHSIDIQKNRLIFEIKKDLSKDYYQGKLMPVYFFFISMCVLTLVWE